MRLSKRKQNNTCVTNVAHHAFPSPPFSLQPFQFSTFFYPQITLEIESSSVLVFTRKSRLQDFKNLKCWINSVWLQLKTVNSIPLLILSCYTLYLDILECRIIFQYVQLKEEISTEVSSLTVNLPIIQMWQFLSGCIRVALQASLS